IDSPQYQRLRNVKQLGFADLAFPGATHTRYAHGLGAMAMATKLFDALAPQLQLEPADRDRFRQTLRLAVLFHDLGHPPLSHATEAIMPPIGDLNVPAWAREPGDRRAGHEDYTLKLLLDSALSAEIRRRFSSRATTCFSQCTSIPPRSDMRSCSSVGARAASTRCPPIRTSTCCTTTSRCSGRCARRRIPGPGASCAARDIAC